MYRDCDEYRYEMRASVQVARKLTKKEREGKAAQDAIKAESEKMAVKYEAFGKVRDLRGQQGGTISHAAMLAYEKGSELAQGDPNRKAKGRFVVLGDQIWTVKDGRMGPKVNTGGHDYWCPVSSLKGVRMILDAALRKGHKLQSVDIESAYLQVRWDEERYGTHYLLIPDEMVRYLPMEQQEAYKAIKTRGGVPVFPMARAIYGHPASGFLFVQKLVETLEKQGWLSTDEAAVFRRGECSIAVYVDDILAAGPEEELAELWKELQQEFKMDPPEEASRFLGMEFVHFTETLNGKRMRCTGISMAEYIQQIGEVCREVLGEPMPADTPISKDPREDEVSAEPYTTPPERLGPVRKVLGMIIWVVRVARPDIAFAGSMMAARITRFSDKMIKTLLRCVGYLERTKDMGIVMRCPDEGMYDATRSTLWVHTDADWREPRSQQGYMAFTGSEHGEYTEHDFSPIDWQSKVQKVSADSTPAAEACGIHAAVRSMLPTAADREWTLCVRTDNKSALAACSRGYSEKLSIYCTKAIGLRLRLIRDLIALKALKLTWVTTTDDIADGFTKVLGRMAFEEVRSKMGVRSIPSSTKQVHRVELLYGIRWNPTTQLCPSGDECIPGRRITDHQATAHRLSSRYGECTEPQLDHSRVTIVRKAATARRGDVTIPPGTMPYNAHFIEEECVLAYSSSSDGVYSVQHGENKWQSSSMERSKHYVSSGVLCERRVQPLPLSAMVASPPAMDGGADDDVWMTASAHTAVSCDTQCNTPCNTSSPNVIVHERTHVHTVLTLSLIHI